MVPSAARPCSGARSCFVWSSRPCRSPDGRLDHRASPAARAGFRTDRPGRRHDAGQFVEWLDVRRVECRVIAPAWDDSAARGAPAARPRACPPRVVEQEHPFLAGMELGRPVPADVGAAGEADDDLLGLVRAAVHLVDVDDGLPPRRRVLADRLVGRPPLARRSAAAPGPRPPAAGRPRPRDDQGRIGRAGVRLPRREAADGVVRMGVIAAVAAALTPSHGPRSGPRALPEDPAVGVEDIRLPRGDSLLALPQLDGDLLAGEAGEGFRARR